MPRVVVPQLAGDDAAGPHADQPEVTADIDICAGVQREHLLLRAGQNRHGGRVSLEQPDGERIEQNILYARRYRARGRGTGGGGDFGQGAGLLRPAGPDRGAEGLQMGLAREAGVERFQLPGGAEQQPGCLVPATLLQRDLAAQVLYLGGTQHVRRPGVGRGQQVERRVQGARVARRPRRVEQPLRPPERIGGQRRCPVQIRGGRGQAAAGLRPAREASELGGDVLVRARGRLRLVPGVAARGRQGRLDHRPDHHGQRRQTRSDSEAGGATSTR